MEKTEEFSEDRVLKLSEARKLQQLLGQQLETVQRALEFNKLIAQQLAEAQSLPEATSAAPSTQEPVVATKSEETRISGSKQVEISEEPKRSGAKTDPSLWQRAMGGASNLASSISGLTTPLLERETQTGGSDHAQDAPTPRPKRTPIFLDVNAIKKYLQSTLTKDEYNVEDLYHQEGCTQAIAKDTTFKNATLFVIFLNTIWIAYDTDNNHADTLLAADARFQIAENAFCAFFSFEIFCRFASFRRKLDAFKDGWFVFDSFLVALMVWETWVMSVVYLLMGSWNANPLQNSSILRALRLFRLLRASRVLRILRSFPELMILVQAMIAAMRSVCGTMGLLFIILYVFAILMTQLLNRTEGPDGQFANVPRSINTLLKYAVFPDQASVLDDMLDIDFTYYLITLAYLSLATLTVMNLLIGVLCEVVGEVAQVEREALLVNDIKTKICEICPLLDGDGDRMVSAAEFRLLLNNGPACRILKEVGVDIYALLDHADFIFSEQESIEFSDFIDSVLQFRGANTATVKDVAHVRKCLTREIEALEDRLAAAGQLSSPSNPPR